MQFPSPGDRVRLLAMPNEPDPVPEGTLGTVTDLRPSLYDSVQIDVTWDNGRTLTMIVPPDVFEALQVIPS